MNKEKMLEIMGRIHAETLAFIFAGENTPEIDALITETWQVLDRIQVALEE